MKTFLEICEEKLSDLFIYQFAGPEGKRQLIEKIEEIYQTVKSQEESKPNKHDDPDENLYLKEQDFLNELVSLLTVNNIKCVRAENAHVELMGGINRFLVTAYAKNVLSMFHNILKEIAEKEEECVFYYKPSEGQPSDGIYVGYLIAKKSEIIEHNLKTYVDQKITDISTI